MTATIQIVLFLLAVLVLVAVVAQRLKTAPSILLVVAGIALALIPGLPAVELAPELVLLVLLPPLIYSAGVSMSWREFHFNLRNVALLAFGCVVFTTCAVAAACITYLAGNGASLRARRHRRAARRGGASRHRAPARIAAACSRDPGG
jgi:CPA1 family monovalent cation:H+ antiporter